VVVRSCTSLLKRHEIWFSLWLFRTKQKTFFSFLVFHFTVKNWNYCGASIKGRGRNVKRIILRLATNKMTTGHKRTCYQMIVGSNELVLIVMEPAKHGCNRLICFVGRNNCNWLLCQEFLVFSRSFENFWEGNCPVAPLVPTGSVVKHTWTKNKYKVRS